MLALLPAARGQDSPTPTPAQPDVRISASLSARPLLVAIARQLRDEKGLKVTISANQTSADDLEDLAGGKADIAFLTRPLTGEERAKHPDLDLVAVPVGMQVPALGVSNDVWDAGVHAINQKTMQAIYEQKMTNWKDAGGPDKKIDLFSFEEGGGIWEAFAEWLYGDNRKAPIPKVDKVANSQDARDALEFGSGSIVPIGAGLVDGSRCHALGIDLGGKIVQPTPAQVASGSYPMAEPLLAVLVGRPTNANRVVTEFMTSPEGQKLIRNYGNFGLDAVPKAPPEEGF